MNRFAIAAVLAVVVIAGCGTASGNTPPPAHGSSTPAPAPSSNSPAAQPAEPVTGAAARSAAVTFFDLYAAHQWAATYGLLAPQARQVITGRVWAGAHQRCRGGTGTLSYKVTHPVLAGRTAIVTVSLAGVASKLGSEQQAFRYAGGRWLFVPADLGVYRHRDLAQVLAALRAGGYCS